MVSIDTQWEDFEKNGNLYTFSNQTMYYLRTEADVH